MERTRSRLENYFHLVEYTIKPKYRKRLKAADRPNIEDIADIVDRGGGDIIAGCKIYLGADCLISYTERLLKNRHNGDGDIFLVSEKLVERLSPDSKTRKKIMEYTDKKSSEIEKLYKTICEGIGNFYLIGIVALDESLAEKSEEIKKDKFFGKMKRHLNEIGAANRYTKNLTHWKRLRPEKKETKLIHNAFYKSGALFADNDYAFGKTTYYGQTYYWVKKIQPKSRYWIYETSKQDN